MHLRYSLTALVSGFITLSLELLGFRILAPYFGYSIYVFGSLIGLILLALATGYWLGGYLADKEIERKTYFRLVLLGGVYLAIGSVFYGRLLSLIAGMDVVRGALLGTFLLFAFPMVVFAGLSPYLIALLAKQEKVGASAGGIFAVGTLGSLAGTFLTSFYLVPTLGTHTTFALNAILGMLLPLTWLIWREKRYAGLALLLLIPMIVPPPLQRMNIVASADSAYSHLEVVDYGKFLGLRAEQRSYTVYSFFPKKEGWDFDFKLYNLFAVPPLLHPMRSDLILGFGAGAIARLHQLFNPELRVTGVEIDPEVVRLGKEYFGMNDLKNIERLAVADVRPYLRADTGKYDLIEMDIFKGGVEVPFYLATREFFQAVREHLASRGILAVNIYDPSDNRKIERPIVNTMASVYSHVYVIPAGLGSYLALGAEQEITTDKLPVGLPDPDLQGTIDYFKAHIAKTGFDPEGAVFTDDKAPVEQLFAEQ